MPTELIHSTQDPALPEVAEKLNEAHELLVNEGEPEFIYRAQEALRQLGVRSRPTTVIVRTYTTYSAYEEPMV